VAIPYITGAAMAIGMRNIVMSARNRRSRTSRRLVDSPRTLPGVCSSWISRLLRLGPPYRTVIAARWYPADEHRGTGQTQDFRGCHPAPRADDHCRVFILYAVLAGLLIGVLTGGSLSRLGDLHFRWAPLIALGMVGQVLLFSTGIGAALGDAAPAAYIASNLVVLFAVGRNLSIPGMILVLIGGAANLITIVANGGYMPVSPEAVVAMGRLPKEGYSNSRLVDGVVLGPLTDIFAMPTWIPLANVFSVGDALIGVGAAIAVVAAMHGRGPLTTRVTKAPVQGEPA